MTTPESVATNSTPGVLSVSGLTLESVRGRSLVEIFQDEAKAIGSFAG